MEPENVTASTISVLPGAGLPKRVRKNKGIGRGRGPRPNRAQSVFTHKINIPITPTQSRKIAEICHRYKIERARLVRSAIAWMCRLSVGQFYKYRREIESGDLVECDYKHDMEFASGRLQVPATEADVDLLGQLANQFKLTKAGFCREALFRWIEFYTEDYDKREKRNRDPFIVGKSFEFAPEILAISPRFKKRIGKGKKRKHSEGFHEGYHEGYTRKKEAV